jgi:ABC-type lipoprotein release transport system permease subunit
MLSTARGTAGVQVIGCNTITELSFSALGRKTDEGHVFRPGRRNQAIIGRKLAEKMKLRPGARFVLMFNDSASSLISAAFRVTAIYHSTNSALDERLVYVQADELAGLLAMPGQIHEIGLKLHRDENVEALAQNLKKLFPGLKTETWKEISPETDFLAKTADTYSYVVVVIIMIALAFGILNTMLMAIMERTREIGMIAALGASRRRIFGLVICETVFLTAAGVPAGIFLAWITCTYFGQTGLDLSGMGEEMMSGYGFQTIIYPEFPLKKLVPVLSVVSITALISGFFPAWKAAGMKPADTLKI